MRNRRSAPRALPSLPFVLLLVLLGILWLAGGASRGDALGQVVVRSVAWVALAMAILFCQQPSFRQARPVWIIALAALALALIQLLPLPPGMWAALPGRTPLLEASAASGQVQPWRPWSIVPGATVNAASSLIVPLTVLVLMSSVREAERILLPGVLLAVVAASAMLGLVQFAGSSLNNPLINDTVGLVSGNFANRNHFALFMALGCLLAPVWMFIAGHRPGWRGPAGLGLVVLFFLSILASGSRAGLGLGVVALLLGLLMTRRSIRRASARYPRWVFPALVASLLATVVLFVSLSVVAGRAASIDRLFALDQGQDMRSRSVSVIFTMIRNYFPAGTGIGSFDPMFRMHEPLALLKPTYFNHAHNDVLEIILDAGLPGLLLLLAALGWWAWASVTAWRSEGRSETGRHDALPRLGSAMLFLVIVASLFDYPARTPMVMAVTIMAGIWLGTSRLGADRSSLPHDGQHL